MRKEREEKGADDAWMDPFRERFRQIGGDLGSQPWQVDVEGDMDVDREDGNYPSSMGTPESDSGPRPEMILAPDSPRLLAQ